MRLLQLVEDLQQHGIDLLQEVRGLSKWELMDKGLPHSVARSWVATAAVYFGPSTNPRKQADAIEAARARRHSLDTLRMINRHCAALQDQKKAWALRLELCSVDGDYAAVNKLGRQRVAEWNDVLGPRQRVTVSSNKDRREKTVHITDAEHVITELLAGVDGHEELLQRLREGGSATTVATNAIIALDDLDRILDGDGEEIVIARTDGSRMTGADYVNSVLAEHDYVTLVHPLEGPANAYRSARFANAKQRLMAAAENPVCAWDGCGIGADKCQIHHLDAWDNGGGTNARDLATCCRYHNGINDDDPESPSNRGHLERIGGQVHYRPPRGGPARLNDHPTARLGGMRIHKKNREQ